jgi:hypothetical protein
MIHSRTLVVHFKKRCAQIIEIRTQNGERFRVSSEFPNLPPKKVSFLKWLVCVMQPRRSGVEYWMFRFSNLEIET